MRHDDSNAGRDDAAPPFVCSHTQGPVKVGWAGRHAREAGRRLVVMHVAPQFKRMFAQAGVEIADLHLVARPVQPRLPPADEDRAA